MHIKNHWLLFTFSRLSNVILKPKKISYIENPSSLGHRIRNRRLQLGLSQKDAGKIIGIEREGICDWENEVTEPTIELYPAIIQFLGYIPFDFDITTTAGKIKKYRYLHGLSQERLAKKFGVGSATIYRIEEEIGIPSKRTKRLIEKQLLLTNESEHFPK